MPPIWKARQATNRRPPTRPESAPSGHLRGREWLTKARAPASDRAESAPSGHLRGREWLIKARPHACGLAGCTGGPVQRQQAATVEVPEMTLVPA